MCNDDVLNCGVRVLFRVLMVNGLMLMLIRFMVVRRIEDDIVCMEVGVSVCVVENCGLLIDLEIREKIIIMEIMMVKFFVVRMFI